MSAPVSKRAAQTVPRLTLTKAETTASLGVSVDSLERHVWPELRIVRFGRLQLVAVPGNRGVREAPPACPRASLRTQSSYPCSSWTSPGGCFVASVVQACVARARQRTADGPAVRPAVRWAPLEVFDVACSGARRSVASTDALDPDPRRPNPVVPRPGAHGAKATETPWSASNEVHPVAETQRTDRPNWRPCT